MRRADLEGVHTGRLYALSRIIPSWASFPRWGVKPLGLFQDTSLMPDNNFVIMWSLLAPLPYQHHLRGRPGYLVDWSRDIVEPLMRPRVLSLSMSWPCWAVILQSSLQCPGQLRSAPRHCLNTTDWNIWGEGLTMGRRTGTTSHNSRYKYRHHLTSHHLTTCLWDWDNHRSALFIQTGDRSVDIDL